MGVGAGLYVCCRGAKVHARYISSPDEFLYAHAVARRTVRLYVVCL